MKTVHKPTSMKKIIHPLWLAFFAALLFATPNLFADDAAPVRVSWHAQNLIQAIANMLIFAIIGIFTAVVGFKIFDKCTPGDLTKEIIENKNVAAAIVGGAVILGVCLIIAAAMIG
jgi:putative membrane protein